MKCQEGFTDFNCDFDINESAPPKTNDCQVNTPCVNMSGDWFCRCLSGWEDDGLTCTDLDDCDPIRGTCEDRGPNLHECVCMPGPSKRSIFSRSSVRDRGPLAYTG